jgi:hypothetical protein
LKSGSTPASSGFTVCRGRQRPDHGGPCCLQTALQEERFQSKMV